MRARLKKFLRRRVWSRGPDGVLLRFCTGRSIPLNVDHLFDYPEEDAMGPLQRSEALLLFAIVQVTRPRVIVEFGFNDGHSSLNFLKAGGEGCQVHSYDINGGVQGIADGIARRFPNFSFHLKSQTDFDPRDIGGSSVDFAFIDASHDLALNKATWEKLLPALSPQAIVAVHDTGTWARDKFRSVHDWFERKGWGYWVSPTEFAHQPDERKFVDWIVGDGDVFAAIHCHSLNVIRHGMTILQRKSPLPTVKYVAGS